MSLDLSPGTEAQLVALALASGVSVEEFVQQMVEEKSLLKKATRDAELPPEEWVALWFESVKSLPSTPLLSDEAVSRESFYGERG